MSAMFLAMVWHARRRQAATRSARRSRRAARRCSSGRSGSCTTSSHELRTPVTIARGHLELLRRDGRRLARARGRARRARADRADHRPAAPAREGRAAGLPRDRATSTSSRSSRTCSCAGRRSRRAAGASASIVAGHVRADEEALRDALDALLENAVKYTEPHEAIELRAHAADGEIVIEVADDGLRRPARGARADLRPLRAGRRRAGTRRTAASGSGSRSSPRSQPPTVADAASSLATEARSSRCTCLCVAARSFDRSTPSRSRGPRGLLRVAPRRASEVGPVLLVRRQDLKRERLRGMERLPSAASAAVRDSNDGRECAEEPERERPTFTMSAMVCVMPGLFRGALRRRVSGL